VAGEREVRVNLCRASMRDGIERLVFIDETSLGANMIKTAGRAPVGKRPVDHAPAGHRKLRTFIAALHHDGIHAPGVTDGAMDGRTFEPCVEGFLAPTLRDGDIVVLDDLAARRSARAAETLERVGARFAFLPRYSPDPDPIEMAFSKLKALLRRIAARTYEDLWNAVGKVCRPFTPQEYMNHPVAAGYDRH